MVSRRTLLRLLAIWVVAAAVQGWAQSTPPGAKFVGSQQCERCHEKIYASWKETRMANVVRDPKTHPEAVLADFTQANPLVTFTLDQVAFVYGSRYKQRFFTKLGDDYFVQPAQWDVLKKKWLPFHVPDTGADWWTVHYPSKNTERPTGPLCDGCHSVNYNIATHTVTEWNVGCEKCHGPGSEHVAHPSTENIVNPDRLDANLANDTCIQCHSQGQPKANPITPPGGGLARYYDWPVGFLPGQRLSDSWELEDHKLGETDFFYFADSTAHKNRMQGNDFIQSVMAHRDIRCSSCHDVHSGKNASDLIATGNTLCLDCHRGRGVPGPGTTESVPAHTHHAEGSAASECTACHMPQIETTLPGSFVAAHTFKFITPKLTEQFNEPNACNQCHKDKTAAWSLEQLAKWKGITPWLNLQ